MAVVAVDELPGGQASLDIDWVTTCRRVFRIRFDTPIEREFECLFVAGIPQVGDLHPFDPWLYVKKKEVTGHGDGRRWFEVTCYYEVDNPAKQNNKEDVTEKLKNPLNRFATARSTYRFYKQVAERTADGAAQKILNTAKQVFVPPVEREVPHKVWIIGVNKPVPAGLTADLYIGKINSLPFYGRAPLTLRVNGFDDERVVEVFGEGNNRTIIEFWRWTIEIEHNPETWNAKPVNIGRVMRSEASESDMSNRENRMPLKAVMLNDGNEPVPDPVCLDEQGNPIDPHLLPGAEVYLNFQIYEAINFGPLAIQLRQGQL